MCLGISEYILIPQRNRKEWSWRTAQAISLNIPSLITAAKKQLSLLARVSQDQALTITGPTLDRAIRRYCVLRSIV